MWKRQNQWKTVLKLNKKLTKETLFTVHTFNFTRKTKRRTLEALKTLGYQNPVKKKKKKKYMYIIRRQQLKRPP